MTRDPGLASWLQLSLTPGLGASTVRSLLKQFGLPEAVLARQRSELASFMAPSSPCEVPDYGMAGSVCGSLRRRVFGPGYS